MPNVQQLSGYYTVTAAQNLTAVRLNLVSDVDYFEIFNYTKAGSTANPGVVKKAWWQRGMPNGSYVGIKNTDGAATDQFVTATTNGFTVFNSTDQTIGASVAVTDISNATPPVVSTASTSGLVAGDVVRISSAQNGGSNYAYNGIDFTIGSVVANTSFTLEYMTAAGNADTAAYRKVSFDPIYYPRRRTITKVLSSGTSTIVTMSVTHGYLVGQKVRFIVPDAMGMSELNGLVGQITAIGAADTDGKTNTITVNIDSSSFTAYAWPAAAASLAFTPGEVIPIGDAPSTLANTGGDQSVLTGATVNQGYRGILIGSAICGATNDVVYWRAIKSTSDYGNNGLIVT